MTPRRLSASLLLFWLLLSPSGLVLGHTNPTARFGLAPNASGALPSTLAATPPGTLPPIVVPQGGLFAVNANPGSRYLIETDPRFSRAGLISSNYFLQQLGLDPDDVGGNFQADIGARNAEGCRDQTVITFWHQGI